MMRAYLLCVGTFALALPACGGSDANNGGNGGSGGTTQIPTVHVLYNGEPEMMDAGQALIAHLTLGKAANVDWSNCASLQCQPRRPRRRHPE